MEAWDRNAIDLVEPGFIEFADEGTGQFGFIAVRGWMDCRTIERDGHAAVEFRWDGEDEGDHVSGRGVAVRVEDAIIEGHIFIHPEARVPSQGAPCSVGVSCRQGCVVAL
jgi:hypothetical protein